MAQKYRHRGYRESEREEERSRPRSAPKSDLTTEERIQRKSMRHAIDRDANQVLRCHSCGRSGADLEAITAESLCPHCSAALHCCRNCSQFDSGARWQCRGEIPEPVADKVAANDCTLYAPRLVLDSTGRRTRGPGGSGNNPRSQFENLFKR